MAFLALMFMAALSVGFVSSATCQHRLEREFTENPQNVVSGACPNLENIGNTAQWRGHLSYTYTETYIEIQWKKIVHDPACVYAMKFFVNGREEKDIWHDNDENVKINAVGRFMLTAGRVQRLRIWEYLGA